jgi:hypothetical protein
MIYRCVLLRTICKFLDRGQTVGFTATEDPIHTEILRVNRQIHAEASSVLYSELLIVISPGDIVGLRDASEDIAKPTTDIWRHNPLYGIGSPGPHGGRVYSTPELDGKMEPHVFSRFTHVSLDLYFDFWPGDFPRYQPMWIDSELNIKPEHRVKFSKFLRRTRIIRDFITLISNSPRIGELYITLSIRAMPGYNEDLHNADGDLPEFYFMAVDTRAVEIFLECGVMDPLRDLTNIDVALLDVIRPWDGEDQELQPKYQRLLDELEFDIGIDWSSLPNTGSYPLSSLAGDEERKGQEGTIPENDEDESDEDDSDYSDEGNDDD